MVIFFPLNEFDHYHDLHFFLHHSQETFIVHWFDLNTFVICAEKIYSFTIIFRFLINIIKHKIARNFLKQVEEKNIVKIKKEVYNMTRKLRVRPYSLLSAVSKVFIKNFISF